MCPSISNSQGCVSVAAAALLEVLVIDVYFIFSHTNISLHLCWSPRWKCSSHFSIVKTFLLPSIQLPEARHSGTLRTAHPKLECRPVFVYLIDLFHQLKIINLLFYFLNSRLTLQKSNTTVVCSRKCHDINFLELIKSSCKKTDDAKSYNIMINFSTQSI